MVKNVIITALSSFLVLFILYGYLKASEAEKNLVTALEYKESAQKAEQEATKQAEIATRRAAEARRIENQLLECQSK